MKGMMVTLLVLMMTGTVIGQQQNQENTGTPGLFTLWLNDAKIEQLKANPSGLLAAVPAHVQGKLVDVLLRHDRYRTDADKNGAIGTQQGRFNLWLDAIRIKQLRENPQGLVADVPEPLLEPDKIVKVILKYESPSANNSFPSRDNATANNESSVLTPSPATRRPMGSSVLDDNYWADRLNTNRRNNDSNVANQQFNSRRNQSDFTANSTSGNSTTLEDTLRRLRGEGSGQSARDARNQTAESQQRIYGPPYIAEDNRSSSQLNYRDRMGTPIAQNPRGQDNSPEFRPRFDSVRQSNLSNPGTTTRPQTVLGPITDNSDLEFQQELIRRERQRLEAERIAEDRRIAEKKVADETARLENERYLHQLRKEGRALAGGDANTPQQPAFPSQRYAANTRLIENPSHEFPVRRSESFTPTNQHDYNPVPSREKLNASPRIAQKGGLDEYRTSMPGPGTNNNEAGTGSPTPATLAKQDAHSDKAYNFLFFMLMFSFGLNIYLAWISRGFYARYNELADELRETFTSST